MTCTNDAGFSGREVLCSVAVRRDFCRPSREEHSFSFLGLADALLATVEVSDAVTYVLLQWAECSHNDQSNGETQEERGHKRQEKLWAVLLRAFVVVCTAAAAAALIITVTSIAAASIPSSTIIASTCAGVKSAFTVSHFATNTHFLNKPKRTLWAFWGFEKRPMKSIQEEDRRQSKQGLLRCCR